MRIRSALIPVVLLGGVALVGVAGRAQQKPATPTKVLPEAVPPGAIPAPQACIHPPHDRLCPDLPHDITETFQAGYSQLGAAQQRPFDNFSWQMFVALNWPADGQGAPIKGAFADHPRAPRVWEFYPNPFALLPRELPDENKAPVELLAQAEREKPAHVFTLFATRSNPKDLSPGGILQAGSNKPLIDRNLNFALYDVRVNGVEEGFIRANALQTVAGQQAYLQNKGNSVQWPLGSYDDDATMTGGKVGSIELKTSWRILDPEKDRGAESRYYTVDGQIYIDAAHSQNGLPMTIRARLGLVGFHILQRTTGPKSFDQDWIWSTFEHVDNSPTATNARPPTDISLPLPASGVAPATVDRPYSFFNPAYTGATNVPPPLPKGETVYKWAPKPPYAAAYATDGYGTQVVRCWKIYTETDEVNAYFRGLVKGTVWENYELVGTQWQGGVENPQLENGNIPRYLSNTTMETYVQLQSFGSCLDCHKFAPTAVQGLSGNFSHLLFRAR